MIYSTWICILKAMREDYVPYTVSNPATADYYHNIPPTIDVNYAFSYVSRFSFVPQYLQDELPLDHLYSTYEEIYNTPNLVPNMDITNAMKIEVIT